MTIKYSREIKIGVVLIIAIFLLYFGMNFLKGLDIFSPMRTYVGQFDKLNSLETSSPVYIKGYKVGQVSKITYDFTKPHPFTVSVVINKDIQLPEGSEMVIISDGLLGGAAVEMQLGQFAKNATFYAANDTLPTHIEGGLIDELQTGMLASLSQTIEDVDSVVVGLKTQLEGNQINQILSNANQITADLGSSSAKLKTIINHDVQPIVDDAKVTVADAKLAMGKINDVAGKIDSADIAGIVNRVDTTMYNVQMLTEAVNNKQGTLGLLLYDKSMYNKINSTIVSADTLITDIKNNPKRYINISVFGGKKN